MYVYKYIPGIFFVPVFNEGSLSGIVFLLSRSSVHQYQGDEASKSPISHSPDGPIARWCVLCCARVRLFVYVRCVCYTASPSSVTQMLISLEASSGRHHSVTTPLLSIIRSGHLHHYHHHLLLLAATLRLIIALSCPTRDHFFPFPLAIAPSRPTPRVMAFFPLLQCQAG